MKRIPLLIGIGGAHIDRRGIMLAPYIRGASIPGLMAEEVGGGMFNALRVAAQFHVETALVSVRGGDAAGEAVAAEAQRRNIRDLSATFLDRTTASYTALLDAGGDVVAALADMDIYESALPRIIARKALRDEFAHADGVLMDANMPQTAIVRLATLCTGKPLYALAISPAKAVRLKPILPQLACLFLNRREALALCGLEPDAAHAGSDLAALLSAQGLKACVMTNGAEHVCLMLDGKISRATPPKADKVVDVTGAGDALCGAATAALMNGNDFHSAVRTGLGAASLTVETTHAVAEFADKSIVSHRSDAVGFSQ